jgi:hypothetical protein
LMQLIVYVSDAKMSFHAVARSLLTVAMPQAGNTKGGSITVPLTSCLTGLD